MEPKENATGKNDEAPIGVRLESGGRWTQVRNAVERVLTHEVAGVGRRGRPNWFVASLPPLAWPYPRREHSG